MHVRVRARVLRVRMHVCVRLRVRECLDAWASACVRMRAGLHARPACVCVRLECVRIRGCARGCATQGYSRGYSGWHGRDTKGFSEGYSSRMHASFKRSSRGSHKLMGCTLGYLGGTPRNCVRACVAVHRWVA